MASTSLEASPTKYTVYSSDTGENPTNDSFILPANTLIDKFVSSLETKCITLASKPEAGKDTPFDSSDELAEWFSTLDKAGTYSLSLDPTLPGEKALQSFTFQFIMPWNLTFSSSAKALESSFGDQGSTIQLPGVGVDADERPMLYCGLLPLDQGITCTVEDVFEYVGSPPEIIEGLPSALRDTTVTLSPERISGNRNAMWFDPASYFRPTIRLQFELNPGNYLRTFFHHVLPGLDILDGAVVAKKIVRPALIIGGLFEVNEGNVIFDVNCVIDKYGLEMRAVIEFSGSVITLTLRMRRREPIPSNILTWLAEFLNDDFESIRSPCEKDIFADSDKMHRLVISLSTTENKDRHTVNSFRIMTEVIGTGKFERVDNKEPVFLVSRDWPDREDGANIEALFWNLFNTHPARTLSPHYEEYQDLQPFDTNPALSLRLKGTLFINADKIPVPIMGARVLVSKMDYNIQTYTDYTYTKHFNKTDLEAVLGVVLEARAPSLATFREGDEGRKK